MERAGIVTYTRQARVVDPGSNVVLMLGQHRRRLTNIKTTLGKVMGTRFCSFNYVSQLKRRVYVQSK